MIADFPTVENADRHELAKLLGAANLVGFLQEELAASGQPKTFRPRVVGDVSRRLAAKRILKQRLWLIEAAFGDLQVGVSYLTERES